MQAILGQSLVADENSETPLGHAAISPVLYHHIIVDCLVLE